MVKPSFLIYPQSSLSESPFHIITDEVLHGILSEKGELALSFIRNNKIEHLHQFDEFVTQAIHKGNVAVDINIAIGYMKDGIDGKIYLLKTLGQGIIYLIRRNKSATLIQGNLTASGHIQEGDIFIFTTLDFFHEFNEIIKKLQSLRSNTIEEIETILNTHHIQESSKITGSSLFVTFLQEEKNETFETKSMSLPTHFIKNILTSVGDLAGKYGKKKKLTFMAVTAIVALLIWSVGFGYRRRQDQKIEKKISIVSQSISQKLNQAEEVAFLNLQKSISLISEAKQDLEQLRKEVGSNKKKEIDVIGQLIKKKESILVKREEKSYEEYFDLAIDEKDATGTKFVLDKDFSAILNSQKNTIYLFALSKKTIEKKISQEIGAAKSFALFQKEIFLFNEKEGVVKIDQNGKAKIIIQKDSEWSDIIDISVYNGNIYLLDRGKDEVYKYLVTEGGYSEKSSYFQKGEATSLKGSNSLSIDSSLYIGLEDAVYKYTAGIKDVFKTTYPEENTSVTKVFTTKDLEKVYVWDKQNASLYVLGKNGSYERQIRSILLSKANDVVFYSKSAFILLGSKIYTIGIE